MMQMQLSELMVKKNKKFDVSVIIVNWNVTNFTKACLNSIFNSIHNSLYKISISIEVIVIDNNSSDENVKTLKEIFPNIKLIINKTNKGFAKACNQGIKISRGRYIFLLNPDTLIHAGCLEAMVNFLNLKKDAGGVTPHVLNPDGSTQSLGRKLPTLRNAFILYFFPYRFYKKIGFLKRCKNLREAFEIEALSGATMMIRRKVLDSIGLLDEGLPMYAEDIDICYRIRKAGWRLYCLPNVSITHIGGASSRMVPIKAKFNSYKTFHAYFGKNHGEVSALLIRLMIITSIVIRIIAIFIFNSLKGRKEYLFNEIKAFKIVLRWSLKISNSEQRTLNEIKEHYKIEKKLASRLRNSTRKERKYLYSAIYDELFQRVYNHPQSKRKFDIKYQAQIVKKQMRLLKRFLNLETKFLEVGAGDCALAFKVAKFVKKVYGVDVSKEIAKSDSGPINFNLFISDGCSIPVLQNSIDIVYSNQLMEHLHPDDAIKQLQNIYKALVPGGIYLCITPNRLNGPHDISKYFDEVATGLHLKEYMATELASLFKRIGFSKIRVLIGVKGLFFSFSIFPIKLVESLLQKLSLSLSRKISRSYPIRIILGIKLIGIK